MILDSAFAFPSLTFAFGDSNSTLATLLTRHIPTVDLDPKCSLCLEHNSKYPHRKALSFFKSLFRCQLLKESPHFTLFYAHPPALVLLALLLSFIPHHITTFYYTLQFDSLTFV